MFRLLARVWPFIRPYRRHLVYLFLLTLPALFGGLVGLTLMRVFFDVVGHGDRLKPAQAWMLHVPLHADRRTVLIHACVVGGIAAVVSLIVVGFLVGYAIWILQRISNLFRVNLYTRMQELSVRFHSEEKIGDAIFRMFQDSAAIPNVIDGLIVQPVIFFPAAIGSILYLLWYDTRMALIVASADARELHPGVDVRQFFARRVHRRARSHGAARPRASKKRSRRSEPSKPSAPRPAKRNTTRARTGTHSLPAAARA